MKIFGMYFYIIVSRRKIDKQKLWALARGIAHVHDNPMRKSLQRHMMRRQVETASRSIIEQEKTAGKSLMIKEPQDVGPAKY